VSRSSISAHRSSTPSRSPVGEVRDVVGVPGGDDVELNARDVREDARATANAGGERDGCAAGSSSISLAARYSVIVVAPPAMATLSEAAAARVVQRGRDAVLRKLTWCRPSRATARARGG
jgi:hypothetical protein